MILDELKPFLTDIITGIAKPGDGPYRGMVRSDMDAMVVRELISRGWTEPLITELFDSFPIGDDIYRNQDRLLHGREYIRSLITLAHQRRIEIAQAKMARACRNFKIIRVTRLVGHVSTFTVTIEPPMGRQFQIHITIPQLKKREYFDSLCYSLGYFYPDYDLQTMIDLIAECAEEVERLRWSSNELKMEIVRIIARECTHNYCEEGDIAWYDKAQDRVLVRPDLLLTDLLSHHESAFDVVTLVSAIRKLEPLEWEYTLGQAKERVWAFHRMIIGPAKQRKLAKRTRRENEIRRKAS